MRKVYISTDNIALNCRKLCRGERDFLPTIIVREEDGTETLHHKIDILGPCRVVSVPEGDERTGRRVWIEFQE